MSRTAVLTSVGHHRHPGRVERTRSHHSATTRPDALDLLLFSFAAGSGWGPARRWKLTTRDSDKGKASVY